jgi:hypothetical protein
MGKYIPDAAKRIGISDYWKMGKPGGWDAVRQVMNARGGYDGALNTLDKIRTAFDPVDTMGSAKWLNRYASFEVARLLTLSPSVSFKHALKLMGNWTIFPASINTQATVQNFNLQARQYAQDIAGTRWKGTDQIADLSRALTMQHHIAAAVSDMAPYEMPRSVIDKLLNRANEIGSSFVNAVERLDRGQTFLASILMSQKKGMTPDQALYGLMDSVTKVNFLTGPDNPKWLKNPFIRTMMMFQGTPFKILEQRTQLAMQAGRDVKNTWDVLQKLRADVKRGEAEFKWSLLTDELTKSKDAYGTPYTQQMLKQMLVMGTVLTTGKFAFDSDLLGHVVHIPGMQLGNRGMSLGLNPAVGAAYQTVTGANKTPGNEDDFAVSRFFNTWLGGTGFPAIAKKIANLSNNDIPAIYRDNKLNYLFGVPKTKEK